MRSLAAAAAVWLAACAPRAAVTVAPGRTVDPSRFKLLAVMPFDGGGRDRWLLASKVAAGLAHADYACVGQGQLETVIAAVKLEYSGGWSLDALSGIRRATFADGLVTGSVDSNWRSASVRLVDARTGDVVLNADVRPAEGVFRSYDEIADAFADVFASHPSQRRAPRPDENPLPDPQ